jgi:plastocyanin
MSKQVRDSAGHLWPQIVGRLGTTTMLTTSDESQQSHAAATGVTLMRIANGSDDGKHLHFTTGANPTATVNDAIIPAYETAYVTVSPGDKVAIISGHNHNFHVTITDILPS